MRRMSWLRLGALVTLLALTAAACGGGGGGTAASTTTAKKAAGPANRGNIDGVLKLGYLLPQTGGLAAIGPSLIKAVEMAVRDINQAGGVINKNVELVGQDDGTSVDVASPAVDKLLSDKVDAIIGAAGSSVTLGVIDKIKTAGVVECSPSNTGSVLTTYPDNGYYFRTAPADDKQAIALADLVTRDGHSNVAIIAQNNDYGQGLARQVADRLRGNGANVAANVAYDPNGTNFDSDVKQAADKRPDAIVLIAYPADGAKVLAAMIKARIGPKDKPIYLTDGMQDKTVGKSVDPNNPGIVSGMKGTAPSAAPNNGAAFFPAAFAQFAPGVNTIYSAQSYDCVVLIALAAERVRSDDPAKIKDAIVPLTHGTNVCTTFRECKALIDQGKDIEYQGASGPLRMTDVGEPGTGQYDIWQFQPDGTYKTLRQVSVGTAAAGGVTTTTPGATTKPGVTTTTKHGVTTTTVHAVTTTT